MSNGVVVVDYGIGNVFSVCNALSHVGAKVELTRDSKKIMAADRLILPGVGAFAKAMEALHALDLVDVLSRYHETQRPFLGICIGMQVLMRASEEFGDHEGLNFIPGRVKRIVPGHQKEIKVPHISWAALTLGPKKSSADWNDTLLENTTPQKETFYYVHSFHCQPDNSDHILAQSDYRGHKITAAVRDNNLFGTQFHPERSGRAGQNILKSFLNA